MAMYKLDIPRKSAGWYVIGGNVHIHVLIKPHWLARMAARWLLGWKWKEQ